MAAGAQGFFPWPFPWPRRKDDEEEEAEEEDGLAEGFPPVLLVPGIGGSILDAVFDNNKRERIWVRLLRADHEFRTKLWSKYNPKTGGRHSLTLALRIRQCVERSGNARPEGSWHVLRRRF